MGPRFARGGSGGALVLDPTGRVANESAISPTRKVVAIAAVRRFLAVQFFSAFSRSLLQATIAWLLSTLTESVFMLGVIGFVHERRRELRDFEVQPVEADAT